MEHAGCWQILINYQDKCNKIYIFVSILVGIIKIMSNNTQQQSWLF